MFRVHVFLILVIQFILVFLVAQRFFGEGVAGLVGWLLVMVGSLPLIAVLYSPGYDVLCDL